MKKWQKDKLKDEMNAILISMFGLGLIITHVFDICPWIAWIGAGILIFGITVFLEIRDRNYR